MKGDFRLSHSQVVVFSIVLVLLIFLSAFFSCAETGLMAVNRYRMRHKARSKQRAAILVLRLLKRPDRLLGMILIGNNVANILASAIATWMAIHLFGDKGVVLATILLTFFVLVFAEVAPKTLAAVYPDRIAKLVAWPVYVLLKFFYPLVWMLNAISNGVLRLFRVNVMGLSTEPLTRDELRSLVYETSSRFSRQYQNMLLSILDLNKISVNDIMIPKHEIIGIDLTLEWDVVKRLILESSHDWLPVYRDNVNQIVGILHLRELMPSVLTTDVLNKDLLMKLMHEPYFVPEGTPLSIQLMHFQAQRKRLAFIVDEYGDVQGMLTLVDILEEIVGEFTTTVTDASKIIQAQTDGSYLVDGAVTVREFNRVVHWDLPIEGARTVSGLIIEYLEAIPRAGTCVRIQNHPIEILSVKGNRVKKARVFPSLKSESIEDAGDMSF